MSKKRLRIRLKEYLAQRGLSVYRLTKEAKELKPATVYAVAAGTLKPRLDTLERLIEALERLTKEPVRLCELLALEEDGEEGPRGGPGPGHPPA